LLDDFEYESELEEIMNLFQKNEERKNKKFIGMQKDLGF